MINPPSSQSGSDVYQPGSPNYTMRRVQNIAFDVAVTAVSEKAGGGKAGIRVLSLELGAEGSMFTAAEQVSRVSFSVPITLKPSDDETTNLKNKMERDRALRNAPTPTVKMRR